MVALFFHNHSALSGLIASKTVLKFALFCIDLFCVGQLAHVTMMECGGGFSRASTNVLYNSIEVGTLCKM